MTHNYLHDLELLRQLLPLRLRYLGCLGPKRRTERLLLELAAEDTWSDPPLIFSVYMRLSGWTSAPKRRKRLRFRLSARSRQCYRERAGGELRVREGTIHDWSASLMFAVPTMVEMGQPMDFAAVEVGVVCEV